MKPNKLCMTIKEGDVEKVKLCLNEKDIDINESFFLPNSVNDDKIFNGHEITSLTYAIFKSSPEIITCLVDAGAQIFYNSGRKDTPICSIFKKENFKHRDLVIPF